MLTSITNCFSKEGVYLEKDIQIKLALHKGKETKKSLGSFHVSMQGTCNVARKILLYMGIAMLAFFVCRCMRSEKE